MQSGEREKERKVESQVNESEYCAPATFANFAASQRSKGSGRRKRGRIGRRGD